MSDPSDAAVANAKVVAKSSDTGQANTVSTNAQGQFRIPLLRPGQYLVVVAAPGFQDSRQTMNVSLGQVVPLTVKMGIQQQTESVTVMEAPSLLQNEDANLTTTFNAKQLESLPAPGNDMTAYALTAPGVTVSTGGGYGNFSVFGLPGVSNLFTINGSDNMDPYLNLNNSGASNLTLGSNEIQEAAVVINGYTGQYGRQAGAQINYVTKSGTNAFHGNAGFWYNGRVLNANDWFNNQSGTDRPFAISRQWADSIGGPIKRNKLFFYFNNEGLRYVLPGGGATFIPTTNFSAYVLNNLKTSNPAAVPIYTSALNLYAGSAGASRATNVPITADDPGGCGDFTGGGFGVTAPCARTFRSTANNLNTEWLIAARVDYNITDSDRVYFRYNQDGGVQATGTDPINPVFNANSVQPSQGGQFGYTKSIGTSMTNQLLLSGSYYSAIFGPPNLAAALAAFPTTFAFGDGDYSNVGGSDNAYPQGRNVGQWQVIDDFSYVRGRHEFKVGMNFRRNYVSSFAYGPNTSGLLTFNSLTDFVNGSLDNGSTYSQAFTTIGGEGLKLYSLGFYGQDQWRVNSRLTATLALRLDRNSNITCKRNCFNETGQPFANTAHDAAQPYNAVIKTGLSQAFPGIEPIVAAPRIGLAYNITNTTVLRGGVGLFSDLYQGLIADRFLTNTPNVASFTANSGLVAPGVANSAFAAVANSFNALQKGFGTGATLAQLQASVPGFTVPNFNTIANKIYNPKYVEWNLELQQAIAKSYIVSVNYVGNHGYDEINQTLTGNSYSSKSFATLPAAALDKRFAEVRELNNAGYSNYDGIVSSFKWRMANNFQGMFNYTFSHSLDTCSNGCLEPFNALTAVSLRYQINPANLANPNYGNSDYDTRHAFSLSFVYTVAKKFNNPIVNGALSGWTIGSTSLHHSGYPFSIVNSGVRAAQSVSNASGIATEPFIADVATLGTTFSDCTSPVAPCFKGSQFVAKANQHDFGNVPRNSFRGPGYFDSDLNVNKTFAVREHYRLLVGVNFYNLFNHPNFDLPNNNLAVGTFGTITGTVSAPTSAYGSFQGSAVSGRVIQTQVKFSF